MKLETSVELLERVRAKQGASWWALQRIIPASESTVNNWKHRRSTIDRKFVPRIAELLGEAPEYILACVENERTEDAAVQRLWERIAVKFRAHAASVVLALVAIGSLGALPFSGVSSGDLPKNVYSVKLRRWLRNALRLHPVTVPAL